VAVQSGASLACLAAAAAKVSCCWDQKKSCQLCGVGFGVSMLAAPSSSRMGSEFIGRRARKDAPIPSLNCFPVWISEGDGGSVLTSEMESRD